MELGLSQMDWKQEAGGREKIYFGIILLLIVVLFARWFYIPKIKQIKMVQVEIRNNAMQIDTLKQFAQLKLPAPKPVAHDQEVKAGTKFEKAVEASMKSQQQVVAEIVKLLTSNDVLAGVSLTGMSFGAEIDKGPYGTVPVEIEMAGKYAGILGYLEHVEKFGKLVTADNVELTAGEKTPSVVHAKISASIYVVHAPQYGQPPAQPAKADASGGKK